MLLNFLEKIAEMFPKEHYQSRLDNYLADKQIKSGADIEYWTREYERNHSGSLR